MRADAIAWGIGLIALGGAISTLGYRFLKNYNEMADSYYQELSDTRTLFPRRHRLEELPPGRFREMLGIPTIVFGLLFVVVGVLGLVEGF
jgi:hypothetical protein